MTPPIVKLFGNKIGAESLRGFALSQLRILLDTMKFQGLKQYTRVVRFCDGSFIRAYSSFGRDSVSIYVPPVSVAERKVVGIEEAVVILLEPFEVGIDIADPVACSGTARWNETCREECVGASPNSSCDTAVYVGNNIQLRVICAESDGCSELCGYSQQYGLDNCGGNEDCDHGLKMIIEYTWGCPP